MAADGSVTIDINVNGKQATVTLDDFKQKLNGLDAPAQRVDAGIKNIVTSLGLMKVASLAVNTLKSSLDGAIARYDTLNNYPKVMQSLGYSAEDAARSTNKLKDGIQGLPTTLDSIVNNTQMLVSSMGDLDKATDLSLALNNMFLASGKGAEEANRAFTQFTQMLSKGKVDMQSWQTMMEVAPGQLNQVAKSMLGADANARTLYSALQDGTVTFDQFVDEIIKANSGLGGLEEQARNATGGIATSMTNVKTAFKNGMEGIIRAIDEGLQAVNAPTISGMLNNFKQDVNSAFGVAKNVVSAAIPYIVSFVKELKGLSPAIIGVVGALVSFKAAMSVMNTIRSLPDIIGNIASSVNAARNAVSGAGSALKVLSELLAPAPALINGVVTAEDLAALAGTTAAAAFEEEAVAAGMASTASGGLLAALAPFAAVFGAVAVAVGGVVAAFEVQEQRQQRVAEALGPLATTTDEMVKKNNELADSMRNTLEPAQQQYEQAYANSEVAKQYLDAIMQQIDADGQSAASKALIAEEVTKLNELIPGLNLQYDATTNSLNMTKDAIIASADAMVYQAQQAAYTEVVTNAYKNQAQAIFDLQQNEYQQKTVESELATQKQILAEMEGTLTQYAKMTSQAYQDQRAKVEELEQKDEDLKTAHDNLKDAVDGTKDSIRLATEVINGTFDPLNIEKQKTDEAAQSMDKFGHESEIAAGQVSTSASSMSGSASAMAGSVNASASSAGQGMIGFGKNAQSGSSTAVNAAYNAQRDMSSSLSSLKNNSYSWGHDMMTNMSSGIERAGRGAVNAAYNVASQINALLHFSRPDKGPLRDYEEWMPHMMQGLAKGINQYSYLVDREIRKVATNLTMPNINASAEYSASLGYPSMLTNNSNSNVNIVFNGGISWSGESDIEATMDQIQSVISRRGYRLG